WTWLDEAAGLIRARSFVGGAGVLEDEATGAAAIRLCGALGRALVIRQGVGSLLWVAPDADGTVALTGNVALASGNLSTSR
ncbi:MAG: PhzF family phenazine biosynthesis protein, partial [Actinomycetes bacterium]